MQQTPKKLNSKLGRIFKDKKKQELQSSLRAWICSRNSTRIAIHPVVCSILDLESRCLAFTCSRCYSTRSVHAVHFRNRTSVCRLCTQFQPGNILGRIRSRSSTILLGTHVTVLVSLGIQIKVGSSQVGEEVMPCQECICCGDVVACRDWEAECNGWHAGE